MKKSPRYHHLDALRAIMMILGIVIHSALTYGIKDHSSHWGITDPMTRHISFDALADLIHLFRMPIFFVIAGFFSAMLFYERSARAMIKNRIRRVLLPFIAGVLILIPISMVAFKHSIRQVRFITQMNMDSDYTFMSMTWGESISMMHLWFLYYLMLICFIAWGLTLLLLKFLPSVTFQFRSRFRRTYRNHAVFFLSVWLTFGVLFLGNSTFILTSLSFVPNPITLLTYCIFFAFGWQLYHQRTNLNHLSRHYQRFLYLGILLCFVRWSIPFLAVHHETGWIFYLKMFLAAHIIWLLVYGIIGLFIHKFSKPSAKLRYISDASYWIYLTHLPLTAYLPSWFVGMTIPALFKFLVIVAITSAITILTYDLLVRSSIIGKFLNGRKYSKGIFVK